MKQITIDDRKVFEGKTNGIINSEYQFSTLFIWQEVFGFQYEINKNTLLVFGYQHNGNLQCYYPLGPEEQLAEAIDRAKDIFKEHNMHINFRPLNETMKNNLIRLLDIDYIVGTKPSYSDYIYDFDRLRNYEGKESKKQRKEWNRFSSRYDYEYESITNMNRMDCLHALVRIISEQIEHDQDEIKAYEKIFSNYEQLNLKGGLIRINGVIEAVAVGEPIGDMVLMHLRRANKAYIGIYPSMLKLILNNEFNDYQYSIVNTQDDMGMENIRKAKMSYKPKYLLQKYFVEESK